ncbi:Uma2 family endonuclease [Effusibacillus lacus]|uniref:Putative restriction endonuclease domain-containing protein n=1 Tax=Effusibacillus lacus TaxID=1348429 RepID=A0A292YPL5_9BACL|nr:Uma2 family endonuclease [Effusibacillus lacus]TCS70044.1 Uma2 family endonuclease [Effusibacillus lacus]GAX91116.1 hypothetical protein EFBL_2777 [Effusibacillus lacus]
MNKRQSKPDRAKETPETYTYEDYAALDDGLRYELADGKLELMSPAPTPLHQAVSFQLHYTLDQSCRSEYVIISAPVDVILSKMEVRQPDIVMVHRSRMSVITRRGIEGPPDLVVEITSSSSRRRDKVHKTKAYAKYSVPEYWILDLESKTLEQYVLNGHVYELLDVYAADDQIHSERIACVSFSMNQILNNVPDLPA